MVSCGSALRTGHWRVSTCGTRRTKRAAMLPWAWARLVKELARLVNEEELVTAEWWPGWGQGQGSGQGSGPGPGSGSGSGQGQGQGRG